MKKKLNFTISSRPICIFNGVYYLIRKTIFFEGRNITKHSGKVTLCTILFDSRFDDKLIRQRSGHRSDAINVFKPPSCNMLQTVSNTLQPPKPKKSTSSYTNTKKIMYHVLCFINMFTLITVCIFSIIKQYLHKYLYSLNYLAFTIFIYFTPCQI